jgi:hypothetical protein
MMQKRRMLQMLLLAIKERGLIHTHEKTAPLLKVTGANRDNTMTNDFGVVILDMLAKDPALAAAVQKESDIINAEISTHLGRELMNFQFDHNTDLSEDQLKALKQIIAQYAVAASHDHRVFDEAMEFIK